MKKFFSAVDRIFEIMVKTFIASCVLFFCFLAVMTCLYGYGVLVP